MTRDNLSISRHIIFSTPVSLSVHETDSIDCLRLIGFGPPLPCKFVCKQKRKLHHSMISFIFHSQLPELASLAFVCLPFVTVRSCCVHQTRPPSDIALSPLCSLSEAAGLALACCWLAVDIARPRL